jgi:tRNA-dihydrouridine synthase B
MAKIGTLSLGNFPLLLAPMEDVSDPPFRALCKELGADMLYTEFISSEGLIRNAEKSLKKLDILEQERPIGIQIFGAELDSMLKATEIVEQTKPNVIDINYGCPVKKVTNKGAGAGILKNINKMESLTKAIVKRTKIPVTVKTRLGWDSNSIKIVEVAERLQDAGIKAISIHGRTRVQMYKGDADWSSIAAVKNNPRMHIPVFGNGDVNTPEQAKRMRDNFGLDGAMIGRATIGNPWFFKQVKHFFKTGQHLPSINLEERIKVLKKHLQHAIEWKGETLAILEMRRHYKNYFKGLDNLKPYKIKLLQANTKEEVWEVLEVIQGL